MKKMIFAVLLTAALAGAGCVKTVSGTHAFATTIGQDSFGARYQRSMDRLFRRRFRYPSQWRAA